MSNYPSHFWFFSAWVLQNLSWLPGRILLHFFVHLKVLGAENIKEAIQRSKKEGKGVLFAINHTNELDPIVLLAGVAPLSKIYPFLYTARPGKNYQKNSYFDGWRSFLFSSDIFMRLWGAFPVIAGSKDYSVSLAMFIEILEQGNSLAFFPEGKMTRDEFRGEARGGVGYLAEKTDAIIVPVLIEGLWKMRKTGDFWRRKRHAQVSYGAPFTASELSISFSNEENHFRNIAEAIMDRVYNLQTKDQSL